MILAHHSQREKDCPPRSIAYPWPFGCHSAVRALLAREPSTIHHKVYVGAGKVYGFLSVLYLRTPFRNAIHPNYEHGKYRIVAVLFPFVGLA
jgi:hypothetical protein